MAKKQQQRRVLAVVTSCSQYEQAGYRTGLWLGELTHFTDVLTEAGFQVDVASISGGEVPLDPESLAAPVLALGGTNKRYRSREYMDQLRNTPSVTTISADGYEAVFLAGGHGTMMDFDDTALARLVTDFAEQGKVVSAVCHGPSGLLAAQVDGVPLLKGRRVTGYSWAEEKLAHRAKVVPFRLQDELKKRGAKYSKALRPMGKKVVVDGKLVTGQNPLSAKGVGEAVVALLTTKGTN